ncbi:MAG TPA: hypothetical protein VGU20_25345 [Stellaceae bacterium]|nr:hypothetical protein [Stellaceae bacterium]
MPKAMGSIASLTVGEFFIHAARQSMLLTRKSLSKPAKSPPKSLVWRSHLMGLRLSRR